jgi:hypothetical protein
MFMNATVLPSSTRYLLSCHHHFVISEELTLTFSYYRGHGTQVVDGKLVATVCGLVERVNKLVTVRPVHQRCATSHEARWGINLVLVGASCTMTDFDVFSQVCCCNRRHRRRQSDRGDMLLHDLTADSPHSERQVCVMRGRYVADCRKALEAGPECAPGRRTPALCR